MPHIEVMKFCQNHWSLLDIAHKYLATCVIIGKQIASESFMFSKDFYRWANT